jgi:hypothetical protein
MTHEQRHSLNWYVGLVLTDLGVLWMMIGSDAIFTTGLILLALSILSGPNSKDE